MQNLFYSSCPVVRRSTETFAEWTTIGGERRRFEFEREIHWLQESEAVLRFVHGGEELQHESTHNDYYGYLTAAQGLDGDARRAIETYRVTADSSLVVEIVSRVFQRPVVETGEARKYNLTKPQGHKSQWADVPDESRKEVEVDGETIWPRLARVELAEEVVWSSKLSRDANEAVWGDFRVRWASALAGAESVAESTV
ncbi:hypothetical protein [Variovorax ginsengisoli]|uniref:Uncharacterized protein n=1 Tax=Variovorax ginsengisoli TaxID=363844 RepID=A0ABT8SAY1_9BURK|nr:hypothetical protein [Variovorax ginsengisoli]MDN8616423.1 hypothetical protein [Variovorax ginsengisoli]MDO1535593.1 hypothetical protein [Variovorax ginsengisoli]